MTDSTALNTSVPDASEITPPNVLEEINNEVTSLVTYAKHYSAFHILTGALVASHLPIVSWIVFSYVFSLPTIIVLQHPDWLYRMRKSHCIALPAFVFVLVVSDLYALYCISRLI